MKKAIFILVALVLAVSVSLIGCGPVPPKAPTAIIVATARDTNDCLAIFERMAAGPVMRAFRTYVNNETGGIALSAYGAGTRVPLEIDRREIRCDPWDVGDVTQGICDDIDAGRVHYLWGGPGTDCIYTQAPIANAEATVLFTFEGGATNIYRDPDKLAVWPYVFINLSYSDWYQLPVLSAMLKAKLGLPATEKPDAYVAYIAGEHGEEYLMVAEENFDVVGSEELPFFDTELDPVPVITRAIQYLEDPGYDIFCSFAYPGHNIALVMTAQALDFNPPAYVTGPGANFGFFPFATGGGPPPDPTLIDGMLAFAVANFETSTAIATVYGKIADQIEADGTGTPGEGYIDYWGHPLYWAALQMWVKAIEAVGDIGNEALREKLASYQSSATGVDTILGRTWYRMYPNGGGNLDYLCHTGEIGQWQGGNLEIVGPVNEGQPVPGLPNYKVTGNFMFPMTDQWNWLD